MCDFSGFPVLTTASGTGKFLFEGTIGSGPAYDGNFYTTTVNNTLFAGVTYTIQFDISLVNAIGQPTLTVSLNGSALGAAFQPSNVNNWQTISYTYTPVANIVNPQLNFYNAQSTGVGNDFGIDNILISYPLVMLPVHFTDISAKAGKQNVLLQWGTASETGSNYFSIERSTDGLQYSIIGNVQCAGNSSAIKNYVFTDKTPLTGTSYYRLKQVDNNGSFIYSAVMVIHFTGIKSVVNTYPNPATGYFTIVVANTGTQPYRVTVTDMSGKLVQSGETVAVDGKINITLNNSVKPGIYMVSIKGNSQDAVNKIVVH